MNEKKNIETLCRHCLGDYLEAGMIVTYVPGQKYKDTCTYCQRGMGWDYEVKPVRLDYTQTKSDHHKKKVFE